MKWIEYLLPIIQEYRTDDYTYPESIDDPLDGDEVDRLCNIIKAKINLHEGNITQAHYDVKVKEEYR